MRRNPYIGNRLASIYRGWWVLLGATVLALISGGILYHGAAVFFSPIRRDLNLSSANTSLIFTLARAQTSLVAPLYGWLVDRVGARPLIVIGALISGIGLIAITLINNYFAFLLAYLLLVSVPSSFGFGQTLLTAVNGWFIRRKAIAMTILLTGFAAGGAIFVYPLGVGVDNIGWRATSVCAGIVVLVIGLLVSRLVVSPPGGQGNIVEEVEQTRESSGESSTRSSRRILPADYTLSEAIRTRAFWILLAASTLRISAETGLAIHIIPIMVWQGAEEEFAAGLVSAYFLMSIPFRLGLGMAGQRLSFQPLIVSGLLAAVAGCVLLTQTEGVSTLYPFIVLLAIYEGAVVLQWVAIGNYFGRRSYGAITGIMRAFDTIGTFSAPWYAGWMFDRTGSYSPALVTFAAMLGIAALLYCVSRRPNRPSS